MAMIISFDFDGTLDDYKLQVLASKFINNKIEVWIVTSRKEGYKTDDLIKVANKLKITAGRIVYTNGKEKHPFIKAINSDLHIDNNATECDGINCYTDFCSLLYT